MPYLKDDIYSMVNTSRCYGKKGAEITIVRSTGFGFIVKLKETGEGFPLL